MYKTVYHVYSCPRVADKNGMSMQLYYHNISIYNHIPLEADEIRNGMSNAVILF